MYITRRRLGDASFIVAAIAVLAATTASYAQNTVFVPLPPCRIADTRSGGGSITTNTTRSFNVVGATTNYGSQGGNTSGCGVPGFTTDGVPAVQAIAVNVVAVDATGMGNLRAFPGNLASSNSSTLNYQLLNPKLNIANGVIVPVRQDTAGGDIKVFASQTVDVVMDVTGYFTQLPIQVGLNVTSPNLIGGFSTNSAGPTVKGGTIAGGGSSGAQNRVSSDFSFVGGGKGNDAGGAGNNNLEGLWSTIGGGEANIAAANHSTIGGGINNVASGDDATVGGGSQNQAVANFSTIPGGSANTIAQTASNAFAAGSQAQVLSGHSGAMLFSDNSGTPFTSVAAKEFAVRATNGFRFITSTDLSKKCTIDNLGNLVCSGTLTSSSDRAAKMNFTPVDPKEVLARVAALPIQRWNYRDDTGTSHIGPMAQDFYAAFQVGVDDKHISMVDADGVALAAIQALYTQLQQKDAEIRELRTRLNGMQSVVDRVERLERQLPVRTVSLDEPRH